MVGTVFYLASIKLQRAQRVGNILERVNEAVGEVVRGIDAPLVARVRVRRVHDAVRHEIPHVGVGTVQIAPHPEGDFTLLEPTCPHLLKLCQVDAHRLITLRACTRSGHRETVDRGFLAELRFGAVVLFERFSARLDLFGRLMAYVRLAGLDKLDGQLVQLVKVIGAVSYFEGLVA